MATYEELLQSHGKNCTWKDVKDAKIYVDEKNILLCQNKCSGDKYDGKLGYKYCWLVHSSCYEEITILKEEYITTHEELLKLHGKKVTCYYQDIFIEDALIYVWDNEKTSGKNINICHNNTVESISNGMFDKTGYKRNPCISSSKEGIIYEKDNREYTKIKLKEEQQTDSGFTNESTYLDSLDNWY